MQQHFHIWYPLISAGLVHISVPVTIQQALLTAQMWIVILVVHKHKHRTEIAMWGHTLLTDDGRLKGTWQSWIREYSILGDFIKIFFYKIYFPVQQSWHLEFRAISGIVRNHQQECVWHHLPSWEQDTNKKGDQSKKYCSIARLVVKTPLGTLKVIL